MTTCFKKWGKKNDCVKYSLKTSLICNAISFFKKIQIIMNHPQQNETIIRTDWNNCDNKSL